MFQENEDIGLRWKKLKRAYELGKLASYWSADYYDWIESETLGQNVDSEHRSHVLNAKFDNIDWVVHKIKSLSMEMHRYMP